MTAEATRMAMNFPTFMVWLPLGWNREPVEEPVTAVAP